MLPIVIVNWNGHEDTIECLESLLRLDHEDARIIVCDNGSDQGSVKAILDWAHGAREARRTGPIWARLPLERRREPSIAVIGMNEIDRAPAGDPFITVITIGTNLGFAGGNNVGIRHAQARCSFRLLWLLNNDTVVAPGAAAAFLARYYEGGGEGHRALGLCAGELRFYDTPDAIQALGGGFNPQTLVTRHLSAHTAVSNVPDRTVIEEALAYPIGANMVVSSAFLEAVGLMEEGYFLFYEELDWALRGRDQFQIGFAPGAVVYHKEGGTIGTSTRGHQSAMSTYFLRRGLLLFTAKFFPRKRKQAIALIIWYALGDLAQLRFDRVSAAFRAIKAASARGA
ncbi:MAG: glycosyltransferase family 2 protein [Alphaproteobacteria bacterium]